MATRALQDWARLQCSGYRDVDVRNMSSSFRDGLAFCALIHHHRPDLLDFDSLSKENVFENNRLAFEVAETELGIPALLDPTDMVAMRVPDRLSILTYVSQIYHCFNSQSHGTAGVPHSIKRSAKASPCEPTVKKPVFATEQKDSPLEGSEPVRRGTLSSSCALCSRHVHLVQRYLVDGKLYHRNCFRCKECCNTLLPGAYKPGSQTGTFVCTHHLNKLTGFSQRPGFHRDGDLSEVGASSQDEGSAEGSPLLGGRAEGTVTPARQDTDGVRRGLSVKVLSSVFSGGGVGYPEGWARPEPRAIPETGKSPRESAEREERPTAEPVAEPVATEEPSENHSPEMDPSGDRPIEQREEETGDSSPSEPARQEGQEGQAEAGMSGGQSKESGQPSPSAEEAEVKVKPLPIPRKTVDMATSPGPTPRPTPRPIPKPRANLSDSSAQRGDSASLVNGGPADQTPPIPKPRDRPLAFIERNEPGRSKDPPWMSLVNAELKRRLAPPRPGAPTIEAKPKDTELPQHSLNPFGEDEEEEEEKTKTSESSAKPSHPWYSIQAANSPKNRKRLAPRAPNSSPSGQHGTRSPALSSSPCPSPSLSLENVSLHSGRSSPELGQKTAGESSEGGESAIESPTPTVDRPPQPSDSPSAVTPTSQSPAPARRTPTPGKVSPTPASQTPKPTSETPVLSPNRPPPKPPTDRSPILSGQPGRRPCVNNLQAKSSCKENPFDRKSGVSGLTPKLKPRKGPKPARPPAPGHGFPLIKRKVHSDQYIPEESIQGQLEQLEQQLDELERCGVSLEEKLRGCENGDEEDDLLTDWFKLIHEKHILVRRELELVYTFKQQNLEERQADVEYELRCLLNKPEKDWTDEDRSRDAELMQELITVIEQRNAIINSLDEDKQREDEEDKMLEKMIKNKEFHRDPNTEVKKKTKFKGMKMLKFLSNKQDTKHKAEREKEKGS